MQYFKYAASPAKVVEEPDNPALVVFGWFSLIAVASLFLAAGAVWVVAFLFFPIWGL